MFNIKEFVALGVKFPKTGPWDSYKFRTISMALVVVTNLVYFHHTI
jgi:hypothetical protein